MGRRYPMGRIVLFLAGVLGAGCGVAPAPRTPVPTAHATAYPHTAADVRFMTAMIGHHAQALEMTALAPSRAGSRAVRTLAERIANGQADEIATMRQWLADRGHASAAGAAAAGHDEHAGHAGHMAHGTVMPGMLSPEQLGQLAAARGADFDRLFLTFMIQHHRGAVEMVSTLLAEGGAAQDPTVFRFAADVEVDQTTEIERMQRMLAAQLFGDAPR